MKLARFFNHAWRDVVAGERALMTGSAQKAEEVPETAAQVDYRGLRGSVEETKELSMARFMGIHSVPVDPLRRCSMCRQL